MEETKTTGYTPADYKNSQNARWCPGCGDHAILNVLHKARAVIGVAPKDTAVISGSGCSSRLPYYMNTYGMHTMHGRAAASTTRIKTANPELTVWQNTGDGDGFFIKQKPAFDVRLSLVGSNMCIKDRLCREQVEQYRSRLQGTQG